MALPLGLPPVRFKKPTLWCAVAVGAIYFGCAAYEVREHAEIAKRVLRARGASPHPVVFEDIEKVRGIIAAAKAQRIPHSRQHQWPSPMPRNPAESPILAAKEMWQNFSEPQKMTFGIVSVNVGIFVLERLFPRSSPYFSHVPATTGRNFTLLTSVFGHVGLTHLALNMYGVMQFVPPVMESPTFAGSGSQFAAFYLSSGILSAFAFHAASAWPRPLDRMLPVRGASGAVMAAVGAYGMSYPDHGLGIVFIPGSLPASQFLIGLALFETYGLFVGFKRLPLAHAGHLAGLAIGSAYVYFDGRTRLWDPVRRRTFSILSSLHAI